MLFHYPALSNLDVVLRIWPGDGNLAGADVKLDGVDVPIGMAGTVFRGRLGSDAEVRDRLADITVTLQRTNMQSQFASIELELFQLLPEGAPPLPGLPASAEFNNMRFPLLRDTFADGQTELRMVHQVRII